MIKQILNQAWNDSAYEIVVLTAAVLLALC